MTDAARASFERRRWSELRAGTSLPIDEHELAQLRGVDEPITLDEVADVFLPLARLLDVRVAALRHLESLTARFLGETPRRAPFVIGITGAVAVGKSTFARVLRSVLAHGPDRPRVELVSTDGFLYPNAELDRRGLAMRKGFPETYDVTRLVEFLAAVKCGAPAVDAPLYSHVSYDVVDDATQRIERPDVLLLEGLNVLQVPGRDVVPGPLVSDFFDFSIYLDAAEEVVRDWFVERFLVLRADAASDDASFFRTFARLTDEQARATALTVWDTINGPNLRENIAPTRPRADLVMHKAADHRVDRVSLRRI